MGNLDILDFSDDHPYLDEELLTSENKITNFIISTYGSIFYKNNFSYTLFNFVNMKCSNLKYSLFYKSIINNANLYHTATPEFFLNSKIGKMYFDNEKGIPFNKIYNSIEIVKINNIMIDKNKRILQKMIKNIRERSKKCNYVDESHKWRNLYFYQNKRTYNKELNIIGKFLIERSFLVVCTKNREYYRKIYLHLDSLVNKVMSSNRGELIVNITKKETNTDRIKNKKNQFKLLSYIKKYLHDIFMKDDKEDDKNTNQKKKSNDILIKKWGKELSKNGSIYKIYEKNISLLKKECQQMFIVTSLMNPQKKN